MCNVALLDSVSMCMCPCEPVFVLVHVHTHTHTHMPAYSVCVRPSVFVCLCRSIKFCSHSCRLVSVWLWSVCLPFNLQPLLLFHSFFLSSAFFISVPLFFIPPLLSLYLIFFTASLFFPSTACSASLAWCPLYPSLWGIHPLFFFSCFTFNFLLHSFTSLPIFLLLLF